MITKLGIKGNPVGQYVSIGDLTLEAIAKALFGQLSGIPLWAVVSAFGVPALIGLIFGLYPANKASRLDPIQSLRYE